MIGLHRFTFALCSKSNLTKAGSPLRMARSKGEARSGSGAGGITSTLAPCFNNNVTSFVFPIFEKIDNENFVLVHSLMSYSKANYVA